MIKLIFEVFCSKTLSWGERQRGMLKKQHNITSLITFIPFQITVQVPPYFTVIWFNPSNYGPIALTSAVAKVFETLLNSHFIKHLKSKTFLSDHQYGFRKERSMGDLLSYLTHARSSSLRNFGEPFVITLDISKAFDKVWHRVLLAKLSGYSFSPSFCKLISSFLFNRFICCCC